MFHHPDTGDAGKMLAAYTAQFGNGVSGTIALEQSRNRGVVAHDPALARRYTTLGVFAAHRHQPADSRTAASPKGVSGLS